MPPYNDPIYQNASSSMPKNFNSGVLMSLLGQFLPLSASERQQNAFNQKMAEDAYNRQIDFYERFNSPQAMVKQYQEAGINPALVAGYSPSMPPSSQAASGNGGSPAFDAVQLAMEMKMRGQELQIQRDIADAEIRNKDADTEFKQENTRNKQFENISAEEFFRLRNQSLYASIKNDLASAENLAAQTALTITRDAISNLDLEFYKNIQDAREHAFLAAARAQEAQTSIAEYEAENYAYRYALELKQVIANTYLSNAHAEQVRKYTREMLDSPGLDSDGRELLSRVAQMSDQEIAQMKKDNKGRTWRNWIGTVSGAVASGAVAAGALKMFFPQARAASVIAAPIDRMMDGAGRWDSQFGTFDLNN